MVSGPSWLTRMRRLVDDLSTAKAMPRVDIVASRGGATEDEILRRLSRRHPRYRIVGHKPVGLALLPLDEFDDVEGYLANLSYARRRVKRAAQRGYAVGLFDPNDRRSELLAIHTSILERQGRPIGATYLDPAAVYETGPHVEYLGVFRGEVIVVYSEPEYAGEIAGIWRIVGHGDYLADGIMFLLTASIVEHVKSVRPDTRYICYDMIFGGGDGLRAFKTHAGFQPHYVRWRREPTRPSGTLAEFRAP